MMTSSCDADQSETSSHRSRPGPRKGHRKSRKGCYNCKRRRIKCQETLPGCANCERLSLRCQYPASATSAALQASPQPIVTLKSSGNMFSMTDMRLFHHYLSTAYPHFPLRSETIWLNYITPISHQCEYLMHAILALSASHLEKLAPSGLTPTARSHARLAMAGLNSAIEESAQSAEDGDAAIATCYALMMQSWYADDGLPSFMILSRSCRAVSKEIRALNVGSVFANDDKKRNVESMRAKFEAAPSFSTTFIQEALESLNRTRGSCSEDYELELLEQLEVLFETLSTSRYEAYLQHMRFDEMITSMDSEQCQKLLDPTRPECQLVLAHIIAMYLIMRPISCRERLRYTATMYGIRMNNWVDVIEKDLGDEYKPYIAWPMMVSELNKAKILEQYTLSDDGTAQWAQRFVEGSTLSGPVI